MKGIPTGKILIVDDEEVMRRSLADILRLEGYQVRYAESGEAALDLLKKESFDLVLLDLKMPGMDGVEVLEHVSQLAPETMIIFLTAHGSLESAVEALRHEVADYLLKPASPQQVLNSVAKALSRRSEKTYKRALIEQIDSSLRELREVERRQRPAIAEPETELLEDGILVDFSRREIWRQGDLEDRNRVKLTQAEGKLLRIFLQNRGRVLTHRELVLQTQGYEVSDWEAPEVLRPLISRLRQKLASFPGGEKWIANVRGTGYVLEGREKE